MADFDALRHEMIDTDDEFRRLHEQHQVLERDLESLYQKSLLSEEDELEVKRIKHEKLRLKDQMMGLLKDRREAHLTA